MFLKLNLVFPSLPLLVVIKITPLDPLLPYCEVAAASFKTVIFSTSFGLIDLKLSAFVGNPSITYKGSVLPLIVPYPLIITVDFAGQLCNYNEINKIAKKHNLLIIQDSAHAISEYTSSSNADITIFSFHPVKHLTTCEGGMAVTNNEQYYNNMKTL